MVATVPERYWRGVGLPGVRQTAGTVLQIIEGARQTVRIAVHSPEMEPELERRADIVVEGPAGALGLLRTLL